MLWLVGGSIMAAAVSVLVIRGSKRKGRTTAEVPVTAVTVRPPLVSNTQSFYAPTLIADGLISAPLLTNSQTFYSPTVSPEAAIVMALLSNSQTFYGPTLKQNVNPALLTNEQAFYGPQVVAEGVLAAPLLNNTTTLYAPALALNMNIPLVTVSGQVFGPAVFGEAAVYAPLVSSSQTFYQPQLKQNIVAPRVINTSGFFPFAVSAAQTPGFALSTPVVTLTTAAGEIPEVDITMGADIYAGYYLRIQRSSDGVKNVSDGSYTTASVNIAHMVRAEEVDEDILAISSDNLIADGYVDPVSGVPWVQQYRWEREDGAISGWSNQISGTVTVATTVLYTAAVNVGTFNKNAFVTVTGTPPLVMTGRQGVGAAQTVRATAPMTGKRQREVTVTTLSDNYIAIGHDDATTDYSSGFQAGGITNTKGFGLRINSTGFSIFKAGVAVQSGSTGVATGDVLSEVPDTNAGTCSYYRTRSGVTVQIGSTLTGISQAKYQAYQGVFSNSVLTANFGQSAFSRALGVGEAMYG